MLQTRRCGELSEADDDTEQTLCGRLQETRNLGGIAFLQLRDSTGIAQLTLPKKKVGEDNFKVWTAIARESTLRVTGMVKANQEAPNGLELVPTELEVLALTVRELRTLWKEAAPEEWKELEKIDKDAEVKDYQENGIWDIAGLRDDLKLMREKLGEKVKPSGKNDEKESEVGAILSPGNNDSIKKSDNSSVKSKLEVLRELKALLDEKIIDDEEFKKMKKEIIN